MKSAIVSTWDSVMDSRPTPCDTLTLRPSTILCRCGQDVEHGVQPDFPVDI